MSAKVPNPIDAYVGSRVRMRRLMLGMSQKRLAEQIGVTFQQVQNTKKAPIASAPADCRRSQEFWRFRSLSSSSKTIPSR